MTRKLITVNPALTLQDLAALFDRKKISGAPVVDDLGVIVGVVTKTDLTRARAQGDSLVDLFYRSATGVIGGDSFLDDEYSPYGVGSDLEFDDMTRESLTELRVADVMNRNVYTTSAETDLRHVAEEMLDRRVHRLVVVDGGRFVGIVSTTDLLQALAGFDITPKTSYRSQAA
jgi:CBS domain-containing protein